MTIDSMAGHHSAYDQYLDLFFQCLEERDFYGTDRVMSLMQAAIPETPEYSCWIRYFQGILAAERDRDWAEATDIFDELLAGPMPMELRAQIYLSQAIVYDNQASWQEAIQAATTSAQLWKQLNRPLRHAVALRQSAVTGFRGFETGEHGTKELEIAHASCLEAVSLLESDTLQPNNAGLHRFDRPRYTALAHEVLGLVLTCMGRYSQARQAHLRRLELAQAMDDAYAVAISHFHLATLRQLDSSADWPSIIELYDQAEIVFQDKDDAVFLFYLLANKGCLYRQEKMLPQATDSFRQSLAIVESIRSGISSEDARHGFFSTAVNIHDNTLLTAMDAQDVDGAFESAELSRSRTLQEKLLLSGVQVSDEQDTFKSLGDVQALLNRDEVLIEYHCTGLLAQYGGPNTEFQAKNHVLYPEPRTILFVVTSTTAFMVDLEISPNTLLVGDHTQIATGLFLSTPMRRALYDKLLKPAAPLLADRRRIYFVPHGPLHHIPFHTLLSDDGTSVLHKSDSEIVYAPSAAILFRELPEIQGNLEARPFAIGYNGDGENVLRFAEAEAQHIAAITDGMVMAGDFSTKQALFANAPAYDLLHFSCHGYFDHEMPLTSALHIGPDEMLTGKEIVENLSLNQTTVILSACEGGLNKIQRGDELHGLVRAFFYAGASAIVATMWRVDERASILFFDKFYRALQSGKTVAAAVTQAQLYLQRLNRQDATRMLQQHWANIDMHREISNQSENAAIGDKPPWLLTGLDDGAHPFSAPIHWASFMLIGNSSFRTGSTAHDERI